MFLLINTKNNNMKKEEINTENLPEIKAESATNEVATNESFEFQTIDLKSKKLPDLRKSEELFFDLMSGYWTPENIGETKFLIFLKIDNRDVLDQASGEIISLECAFFLEQLEDTTTVQISNGSKRLVGAIRANEIQTGSPLKITYKGKKRNSTNQFMSNDWSIRPLIVS